MAFQVEAGGFVGFFVVIILSPLLVFTPHLAHLMKDSQNSSMPPSQDRRKRTRSLRERSGRKPGGQVGHPGTTLRFARQPDRLIVHAPADCYLCGSSLTESEVARTERRQPRR